MKVLNDLEIASVNGGYTLLETSLLGGVIGAASAGLLVGESAIVAGFALGFVAATIIELAEPLAMVCVYMWDNCQYNPKGTYRYH